MHRLTSHQRIFLALIILALIAGVLLFSFARQNHVPWPLQEPSQKYTPHADQFCTSQGDWAFRVFIDVGGQELIIISINERPNFDFPVTFAFPDRFIKTREAFLYHGTDQAGEELSGTVTFAKVVMAITLEGMFNLQTAEGRQFLGTFTGEWGDAIMMCDFMQ